MCIVYILNKYNKTHCLFNAELSEFMINYIRNAKYKLKDGTKSVLFT